MHEEALASTHAFAQDMPLKSRIFVPLRHEANGSCTLRTTNGLFNSIFRWEIDSKSLLPFFARVFWDENIWIAPILRRKGLSSS
jgi:hypothetical protein